MFGRKKKLPYVPTGRTGYISEEIQRASGRYYNQDVGEATYRVEEIGVVGDESLVKVLSLTGLSDPFRYQAWKLMDKTLVPSRRIKWETPVVTHEAAVDETDIKAVEARIEELVVELRRLAAVKRALA